MNQSFMNESDFKKYLSILDLHLPILINYYTLSYLQRSHLQKIPFQNLDFFGYGKQWINFDEPGTLIEPVLRKSGGICFHLNYSFCQLLRWLGFNAWLIHCRIRQTEFDHMAVVAKIDGEIYLVDVGFGEYFFVAPILLKDGFISYQRSGIYRVRENKKKFLLQQKRGNRWITRYSFGLDQTDLKDFEQTYLRHLNDEGSRFIRNKVWSKWMENEFVKVFDDVMCIYHGMTFERYEISNKGR